MKNRKDAERETMLEQQIKTLKKAQQNDEDIA